MSDIEAGGMREPSAVPLEGYDDAADAGDDLWRRRCEVAAAACGLAAAVTVIAGIVLALTTHIPDEMGASELLLRVQRLGVGFNLLVAVLLTVALLLIAIPRSWEGAASTLSRKTLNVIAFVGSVVTFGVLFIAIVELWEYSDVPGITVLSQWARTGYEVAAAVLAGVVAWSASSLASSER